MEQVRVIDMEVVACHGCSPGEEKTPQPFEINVTADVAPRDDRQDRLEDTVSYVDLLDIRRAVMNGPHRKLLETLAGEIASRALEIDGINGVEVEIEKCRPPLEDFKGRVGVRVYREVAL